MRYYEIFDLRGEPFSNSPDPDFFHESRGHRAVLHGLEIALRLRRGLNVVLGEVGTGKTTLCRRLLRELAADPGVQTHLLLDPACGGTAEFLGVLRAMLCGAPPAPGDSPWRVKEDIKDALFRKGVDQGLTVVLVVDEAQKLDPGALEALRELLNYETNDSKLLQIVLLAQEEFQAALDAAPNLADRVNGLFRLGPLSLGETRALVRHRLRCAGAAPGAPELFTPGGYLALRLASGGFPRRIIRLGHKALLALIVQDRRRATWRLVRAVAREERPAARRAAPALAAGVLVVALAVAGAAAWLPGPGLRAATPGVQAAVALALPQAGAARAGAAPAPFTAPQAEAAPAPQAVAPQAVAPQAEAAPAPLSAPAAAPAAAPAPAPGPLLGQVRLGPGESLSHVVHGVYGRYSPALLERVLAVNPALADPGALPEGQSVELPLLGEAGPRFWVQIEQHPTLDAAWAARRGARALGLDARVLPWRGDDGALRFAVTLGGPWATREEAQAARQAAGSGALLAVGHGLAMLSPR